MHRVIEHRGCPIAYTVRGCGPPILFIQGVGVQGDGWQPQIDELANQYTCLSFDNRGLGRSQPTGSPVTVEQMADDARAILDAERVGAAHVVGHSLGGLVAVQLALTARERVRSLSLLCAFANGRAVAPLTLRMMWLGLRTQVGTRRMRRNAFLRLVLPPGPIVEPEATAARLATLFGHDLAVQPPIVREQLRAMRAADVTPRLAELTDLATLVVSATHDPIAPPRLGRALHEAIPGSRFIEVADASHGLPITHAAQVNELLKSHFQMSI